MSRRLKKTAARGWPEHHTSAETEDNHKRLKVIRDNAWLAMEIHYMRRTLFDKHRETVQSKASRFWTLMEGILRDHYLIVVNRVCDEHHESINLRHAVAYVNKHEADLRRQFGVTKKVIRQLNAKVKGMWNHADALQEPRNKYAAHNDARTYMAATREDVTFQGQKIQVPRNESVADDEPPQYLQYTKAKTFDIGSWEENEAFLDKMADPVVLLEQCFGVQATRPQRMMTEGDVRTVVTALKSMQETERTPP